MGVPGLQAAAWAAAALAASSFWGAAADLPVHCTASDAEGEWEFLLGPATPERTSCRHGHPDDPMHEPLMGQWPTGTDASGASPFRVALLSGGAALVRGDGTEGSWTLVSDEALEVRGGGYEFLAFFGFAPLPTDDGGEHLPIELQMRHGHCNETVLGWYRQGDCETWGCWWGRRTQAVGRPPALIQQRRQHRQRGGRGGGGRAASLRGDRALAVAEGDALDWRNFSGQSWVDPPVKQGLCGSCYAVAATQMLSARHRISSRDASLEAFSAAFPLFCGEYTQGCRGGFPYLAAKWSEDVGLLPERCAPLKEDGTCASACDLASLAGSRHRAARHRYIRGGEEAMIEDLRRSGPLAVSFHSDPSLLQYNGGVWQPPPIDEDPSLGGFVAPTHSALLVGFGTDAEAGPYWVLQNAWGSEWGERGAFRIPRAAARERGIEDLVVAADVVVDDRPGVAEGVLRAAAAEAVPVEAASLLAIAKQSRLRSAASASASASGHRGAALCVEPPAAEGDQPVFVRIDAEQNFRSLSFGGSAGTETAVQCAGLAPPGCRGLPSESAQVPRCADIAACSCELHGQGLPYPGMQALAEKVALMCTAAAEPVRVLLIGLGGGAISSYLEDRCPAGQLRLENVEKDGRVAGLATKFFGFRESERNSVEVADGFAAVQSRPAGAYDAVLVDCFAGQDRVPEGCRSPAFLSSVRRLLKRDGLLLQNVWGRSSAGPAAAHDFPALLGAYAGAFGANQTRREVVFDAPESLEYVLYGLKGDRWASLAPEAEAPTEEPHAGEGAEDPPPVSEGASPDAEAPSGGGHHEGG